MNISPVAIDLIEAINNYVAESSKKEYRFTIEEQKELERMLKVMNNQINILVDYELKRDE